MKGFTLVEVMMAVGLLMVLIMAGVGIGRLAVKSSQVSQIRVDAVNLSRATMEAVMAVRANNFGSLNGGTYYPAMVDGEWALVAGTQEVGDLARWVEITKVQRQLSCNGERVCPIVQSGGIVDPVTFRGKVVVSWEESGEVRQVDLESLLTYWR